MTLKMRQSQMFQVWAPVRKTALLEWRRNIELQFRFDPSKGVSPHDLAGLSPRSMNVIVRS